MKRSGPAAWLPLRSMARGVFLGPFILSPFIVSLPALGQELEEVVVTGYFLPSASVSFDLTDITKLRLAAYRALSRVGIEEFNVGVSPIADATATTVEWRPTACSAAAR